MSWLCCWTTWKCPFCFNMLRFSTYPQISINPLIPIFRFSVDHHLQYEDVIGWKCLCTWQKENIIKVFNASFYRTTWITFYIIEFVSLSLISQVNWHLKCHFALDESSLAAPPSCVYYPTMSSTGQYNVLDYTCSRSGQGYFLGLRWWRKVA